MAQADTFDSETLSGALAAGGVLAQDFDAVWTRIWRQDHVPAAQLELCRLRMAQMHGAHAEFAAGRGLESDAGRIAAVRDGSYGSHPGFSPAERAVLEFAEVYAQDPNAISDPLADAVKQHVGEPGLVCLIEALGFIDARIRLALMFSALAHTQQGA